LCFLGLKLGGDKNKKELGSYLKGTRTQIITLSCIFRIIESKKRGNLILLQKLIEYLQLNLIT